MLKNPEYSEKNRFTPGKLRERIDRTTSSALKKKSLVPLSVSTYPHPSRMARIHLLKKRPPKNFHPPQREQEKTNSPKNPFLPADPNLIVADISPTHLIVLNKFPITLGHILIITREFSHQQEPLGREDFRAAAEILREIDGMGFYNGGPDAGASQPHRHFQMIPRPPGDFPLYGKLRARLNSEGAEELPFSHAIFPVNSEKLGDGGEGDNLYNNYLEALEKLNLRSENSKFLKPYNIILTRELFFIVPRKTEHYATISINSLGFVGDFLCQTEEELQLLIQKEPLEILKAVGL